MSKWSEFVLRKIQELEREKGRRISLEEASKVFGVSRPTLSQWISGKVAEPSHFRIDDLAETMGMEVYEVLGYASPEPDVRYISRNWENLPDDARRQIREIVDRYIIRKP
jgi:transcriptional regulator with XRE-family HTH domain